MNYEEELREALIRIAELTDRVFRLERLLRLERDLVARMEAELRDIRKGAA